MKILRSIAAIVVGVVVAGVSVSIVHAIGHAIYPPPAGVDTNDPEALSRIVDQLPVGALVFVVVAWETGAVVGGAAAALIAGCCRCVHAGIIGAFILASSVAMMVMIPSPTWMKLAGLLLPIPASLLAGKFVSLLFPPSREASAAAE